MRYFIAVTGGILATVLLLVFQQGLIARDHVTPLPPIEPIVLGSVTKPKPPETKDRRRPPEKPERPEPIENPVHSERFTRVEPPRIPLQGLARHGSFGLPTAGGEFGVPFDGGAAARVMIAPQYPPSALRQGIEGNVEVEFTILADGSVADIRIVRANPSGVFEQAVHRAVSQWQFLPRRQNGVPVSSRARQVLEFNMPD